MLYLLGGFLIFWLALQALGAFTRANPAVLAKLFKQFGAALALLVAMLFLLRGRFDLAIGFGGLGFWLGTLARKSRVRVFRRSSFGKIGGVSRVRSAMIEMELDHESGAMRGIILAGPNEGRFLDQMNRSECETLYRLCLREDPEGARLLEAYFDRRFAGWSAAREGERDPGPRSARRAGAMSEDEAYEVLGLQKGASREDVVRSHRTLMKKLHPDHGGSTDLAARVNEAKDVLMRRHQ